jgi:anti-anti-sigma factor
VTCADAAGETPGSVERLATVHYDAAEKVGDKGYLRLAGALVGDVSDRELGAAIEHHYVDDGVTSMVVDLGGVEEISLEGVGILVRLQAESDRRGKRFVIENARERVRDKLAITGVLDLLTRH